MGAHGGTPLQLKLMTLSASNYRNQRAVESGLWNMPTLPESHMKLSETAYQLQGSQEDICLLPF